jgi:hypothetical protein
MDGPAHALSEGRFAVLECAGAGSLFMSVMTSGMGSLHGPASCGLQSGRRAWQASNSLEGVAVVAGYVV